MGSFGVSWAIVLLLIGISAPAAGWHDDPPVQHQTVLDGPGWTSARFSAAGALLQFNVEAKGPGPALFQIFVYDEEGLLLAYSQISEEDLRLYLRASASGVGTSLAIDPIVLGGGSAGGPAMSPCGGTVSMWWSTNGRRGTSLSIASPCAGRTPAGVILAASGDDLSESRFEIRSAAPVDVDATLQDRRAYALDLSDLDEGIGVEVTTRPLMSVGYTYVSGSVGLAVDHGWYGRFGTTNQFSPDPQLALRYEHEGAVGSCPCEWNGEEGTAGAWTFHAEGTASSSIRIMGIDARLPP